MIERHVQVLLLPPGMLRVATQRSHPQPLLTGALSGVLRLQPSQRLHAAVCCTAPAWPAISVSYAEVCHCSRSSANNSRQQGVHLSSCSRSQQPVCSPKLQNCRAATMLDELITDRLKVLDISFPGVIVNKSSCSRVHHCCAGSIDWRSANHWIANRCLPQAFHRLVGQFVAVQRSSVQSE